MTKRYNLKLQLVNYDDGEPVIDIGLANKSLEAIQQVVGLAMSEMEPVVELDKHRWGRSRRVVPPAPLPNGPTEEELEMLK